MVRWYRRSRHCFEELMPHLLLACSVLWLCSCAPPGLLGVGEVRAIAPKTTALGLTTSEHESLVAGPDFFDNAAAADTLVDRGSELQLSLQPTVIADSGLLDVALERLPLTVREGVERVEQRTGINIARQIEMVSIWGSSLESSRGFLGMAVYSRLLTVRQMVGVLDAIGEERFGAQEPTDSGPKVGIELTLFADVISQDIPYILQTLSKGGQVVQRVDVAQGRLLVLFQDRMQRHYYAYIWPKGLRVEMLNSNPAKPLEAAARRAVASVRRFNLLRNSNVDLPTLRARSDSDDGIIFLEARVGVSTEMTIEVPAGVLGSDETLLKLLDNWDRMKVVLKRVISVHPRFANTPRLRSLLLAAVEEGRVTESLDGIRLDTEVETELLVDGLKEIPRD